ncbi:sushi, von Willebrand factor type A, EGF and pentraxin domain-containing protein 1-like isoform X2 [Pristis pectinata]|uniref:sushi, von Willebrand factor type A, EGF and pentraxin domain-containing protein 1-like isoform X2 n=1 Tax=Pristis pectinata TaxID=685728 RepID=UPI00223E5F49|nr:sushi, von Willebrand factor type A, EGF and pentraxin domain-containing protein 1-like isoform X2 [Pristis pectinata]
MAAAVLLGLMLAAATAGQDTGDCNKPPILENGSLEDKFISRKTFESGSKVTYRCNPGFSFTELSRRYITCNGGVWEGLQATCQPKSCGSPGEILNGHYEGANTFGSKVIFYCDTGYQMVGRNYRLCEAGGWSGQVPTCEAVKCPDIPPIENGRSPSPPGGEFWEYGMVAEFTCVGDYSLIGERKLTCEPTGKWSNPYPVCKDVNCQLSSLPDTIRIISPPSLIYKYQDKITFQCNEGYQMVGESVIVCGENNKFSHPPPTCKPRDCNKPPILENGSLEDEFISQKTFESGSKVTYRCNPGFSFTELSRRYITCNRGVWERLQATCQPKSCGSPGEILNGHYEGANTFGSKVIFYCDTGYQMVGRNYRLCEAGGWSGQVPTCEAVKCPDIPPIENGRSPSPPSGEFWEYGMVAEFTCVGDYSLIGERKLICEYTGKWSNPYPVCKDVKCQLPSFPDTIRIISPPSLNYKYQDKITFQCNEGYEMVGESVIVCGEDNKFSPPPPSCIQPSDNNTSRNIGIGVGVLCVIVIIAIFSAIVCKIMKRSII